MRSAWTLLLLLTGLSALVGCDARKGPGALGQGPLKDPGVVFDSGRGTGQYDQMTYARYQSEVKLVPGVDMAVGGIRPQIYYWNGSSGFIATIRDSVYQPLASETGLVDGSGGTPYFSDRRLDHPLALRAGATYYVVMEVFTTMSVGIYTTGSRTNGIKGSARYETRYARSDTADHLGRGAIAFELLE